LNLSEANLNGDARRVKDGKALVEALRGTRGRVTRLEGK